MDNFRKKLEKLDLLAVCIFVIIAVLVTLQMTSGFDVQFYNGLAKFISPTVTNMAIVVTEIGSTLGVIMVCLLFLVFPKTRIGIGIPMSITAATSAILNTILKYTFKVTRPNINQIVIETTYSFPSGHAMNNMAIYTILALWILSSYEGKFNKKVMATIVFIFPILIGLSRVYLGVHNISDVLAGFSLGFAVAGTIFLMYDNWGKNIK